MTKVNYLYSITLLFVSLNSFAQFTLDGEFRPRTEYRNGYGSLITENEDTGFATATRVRLNAGYKVDAYEFYASLQDVMVWGENRQLKPNDNNNSLAFFEAWANIKLGGGFATKLGRQTLAYDDQRILGAVGWAQQARNHDAALIKYVNAKFLMDMGFAFNQDFSHPSGFKSVGTAYNTTGFFSYKTMQYLHLKQKWKNFSGSLLLMNNGFQNFENTDATLPDGLSNLQTIGTHLNYKKENFGFAVNAYLQTGKRQGGIKVDSAYLLSLNFNYKTSSKVSLGIGMEIISGNNPNSTDKTDAFFPLYGTNHKFNGFMDYFYVGNHANSIGLFDIHASANIKTGKKSNLLAKVLNFSGEQKLLTGEKSLGTELDFVYTQGFKGYTLKIGYSQMFVNDGMYELKGTTKDNTKNNQNWAWAMLIIKPKFLNTTPQ